MFSSLYLSIYISIYLWSLSLSSTQCRIQTRIVHTHHGVPQGKFEPRRFGGGGLGFQCFFLRHRSAVARCLTGKGNEKGQFFPFHVNSDGNFRAVSFFLVGGTSDLIACGHQPPPAPRTSSTAALSLISPQTRPSTGPPTSISEAISNRLTRSMRALNFSSVLCR